MSTRMTRTPAAALVGLLIAATVAACGPMGKADPSNPGGWITPSPATESSVETTDAPTATGDLRGVRPRTIDDAVLGDLDAYVNESMARYRVPGVAVAVVQDGTIVHLRGYGVAEVDGSEAVTPDTRMKIGSVTKSMTTLMIGTLDDEGALGWETRATEILPWFETSDPSITAQLTVRDLVSNATGIANRDAEMVFNAGELDAEGVVRSVSTFEFDPKSEFRKTFGYSNQMIASGGYVAAHAASGASDDLFADYVSAMEARVFGPIGMPATTFSRDEVVASDDYASPHAFNLDYSQPVVPAEVEDMFGPFAPAGAAWSTARDLGAYLVTQLEHGVAPAGNRVVSAENLEKTWAKQVDIVEGFGYGLGWFASSWKNQPRVGHGGDTIGFSSNVDFLPEADIGVAVILNVGGMSAYGAGVAERLYELAFDQPFEADGRVQKRFDDQRKAFADAHSLVQPLDPGELAGYQGTYVNEALGEVELKLRGNTLVVDTGVVASELGAVGNGTYLFLNPPLTAAAIVLGPRERGGASIEFTMNRPDAPGSWTFVRR